MLAFWQPSTRQFTLAGVNTGDVSTLSGTLASLPTIPALELYYTDATSNLVHLATVPVDNGTNFTATIPADCVFTLVGASVISATITNPANGAQFSSPANVPIQVSVTTTSGSISSVDFYNGTNNLGTVTNPPYSITWSNVPPGNYSLTVNASNSTGGSIISPSVNITVIGPLAQITVLPTNTVISPFDTQQFSAVGTDALGTALNPQPAFIWSAGGGTIDSNGLYTASTNLGGPFPVTASNNSIVGSATVTIGGNVAPSGIGYTWYTMFGSGQNSPRAAAPGINNGDLVTDVPLRPDTNEEPALCFEAAGVVWTSAKTFNTVTYVNGSINQFNDGVFASNFGLQFSPDGTVWTKRRFGLEPVPRLHLQLL